MYCSVCGKPIPDESIFCMFCGVNLHEKTTVKPPTLAINTNAPTAMTDARLMFSSEMKEAPKGMVSRKLEIYFQLTDAQGRTTACDGTLRVKLKFEQLGDYTTYTKNRGQIDKQVPILANQFYRAPKDDNKVWCMHAPEEWFTFSTIRAVQGNIELWFIPTGSKNKLYRLITVNKEPS